MSLIIKKGHPIANSPSLERTNTLWIEDDEMYISTQLESFKVGIDNNIKIARSAEQAIDMIENENFSSFLVDLDLEGGMSGLKLISELKKYKSTIPIRVVTGKLNDWRFKEGIKAIEENYRCKIKVWTKPLEPIYPNMKFKDFEEYMDDKTKCEKISQNPFKLDKSEIVGLNPYEIDLAIETIRGIISPEIFDSFEKSEFNWFKIEENTKQQQIVISDFGVMSNDLEERYSIDNGQAAFILFRNSNTVKLPGSHLIIGMNRMINELKEINRKIIEITNRFKIKLA